MSVGGSEYFVVVMFMILVSFVVCFFVMLNFFVR